MKFMVMLVGPTGCGKSTFRKRRLSHLPCVSPDDFIVGRWSPKKAVHAWRHARNMAVELMGEQQSFVADAQFIDPAVRAEWLALARAFGFLTRGYAFNTPWKQLRENQQARGARGFYGTIPYKVQLRNYQLFKRQLRSLSFYNEGFLRPMPGRSCYPFSTMQIVEWNAKVSMGDLS